MNKKIIFLSIAVIIFVLYTSIYFAMRANLIDTWDKNYNSCMSKEYNKIKIASMEREAEYGINLSQSITQLKECDASGGCWTCIPDQFPHRFNYLSPLQIFETYNLNCVYGCIHESGYYFKAHAK